ncbi:MAG: aminofutalosine synthase MqnE [Candidatus Latescibacterota bacterium]|nr:aminofutalosine synthase MqnE [Candidatus Latescibacterota bacterium]
MTPVAHYEMTQVPSPERNYIERAGLGRVFEKVLNGERLSADDGLKLYATPDVLALGYLANIVRERLHGGATYYVRNQHINYTNICNKLCKFCSFYVKPKDERGYVLDPQQIAERVHEYDEVPITEIHMVGGVNPKLPYDYYLDILRAMKQARPEAHLKAFTMIEIAQIQRIAKKSLEEVFSDLREVGLESLPGGGAEVFSERVHESLFWTKSDSEDWLAIAAAAHQNGLPSNATMLYGHVENAQEKVYHLSRLREIQDSTGGFLAYIPLSFHPERTGIDYLPGPTGDLDLREVAIGRLMLDNFLHIKTFWIMNTIEISQVALWYGANDLDGTVMDYEITRTGHEATRQRLTQRELLDRIVEAGRQPVERDSLYNVVDDSPEDLLLKTRVLEPGT